MLRLGFGFVEVGTVTPRPQPGNPKPRLFRLTEDRAVINRFGFNSDGLDGVAARLRAPRARGIVGANIGKNRDTQDDIGDYVEGVALLAPLADYLAINVSSPNTPGLRDLQRKSALASLLRQLLDAACADRLRRCRCCSRSRPTSTADERGDIAEVALVAGHRRADRRQHHGRAPGRARRAATPREPGGLSGRPLFEPSTALLAEMYRLTRGKLPLIGVGGIASAADAYAKIRAGASLVQLYTALVYHGPGLVGRIKHELAALFAATASPRSRRGRRCAFLNHVADVGPLSPGLRSSSR